MALVSAFRLLLASSRNSVPMAGIVLDSSLGPFRF